MLCTSLKTLIQHTFIKDSNFFPIFLSSENSSYTSLILFPSSIKSKYIFLLDSIFHGTFPPQQFFHLFSRPCSCLLYADPPFSDALIWVGMALKKINWNSTGRVVSVRVVCQRVPLLII